MGTALGHGRGTGCHGRKPALPQVPPVPGMSYPESLWLETASLGWHRSRGLPAVPLTGVTCMAEEQPTLPSLSSTSPSWCPRRGGSPARDDGDS